ncbi:MAG: shikimate kinase [Candidatus Sulfotelmatobacter sp.]
MGAGKSTVGRAMSERLGWIFEDLDDRIERREGRKVAEIFRDSGETAFRRAEHTALREVLREVPGEAGRIIALGGGAFIHKRNATLIESAGVPTVFLEADCEELWGRCLRQAEREGIRRPLLVGRESFHELYEARKWHYLRATFLQKTGGLTIRQIAAEVIKSLGLDSISGRRGKQK